MVYLHKGEKRDKNKPQFEKESLFSSGGLKTDTLQKCSEIVSL